MCEFYVISDMEGVTGLSSYETEMYPHCPDYPRARASFVADMRAALDGARDAGATHFTVYDIQYRADNLVGEHLGPNVALHAGKPLENGLRRGQAGLFIIGLHARAGVEGILPHTYQHAILSMTLNGEPVGEIAMEAYGAAALGIPLCLVTADEAGCREAEALAPGVVTVATKGHRVDGSVEFYEAESVRGQIRRAASEAVRRSGELTPLPDPGDCRLEVRYNDPAMAAQMAAKTGVEMPDDRTLAITGSCVGEVYEQFRLTQVRS